MTGPDTPADSALFKRPDWLTAMYGPPAPWWVRWILLIDILGAVALGVGMILTADEYSPGGVWTSRAAGVFMLAPYLLVAWRLGKRPPVWVLGVAAAVAVLVAGGVGLIVSYSGMGLATPGESGRQAWRLVSWLLAWALVQVVVILWVVWAVQKVDDPGAFKQAWFGFGAAWAWPTLYIPIAFAIGGSAQAAASRRVARDVPLVHRAVVAVADCAYRYADLHPGQGYPRSLDALGPKGTKCLDKSILGAQKRLHLQYEPAPLQGDWTANFTMRADIPLVFGDDRLTLLVDSTGMVRMQEGTQPDTLARITTDGMPDIMGVVRDCIEAVRGMERRLPSAEGLEAALRKKARRDLTALGCDFERARGVLGDSSPMIYDRGYRMSYTRGPVGYALDARPVQYAVTALRSYRLDATGALRVTAYNRPATDGDQALPPCHPFDPGDCAPLPASLPPRVALVHADTVPRTAMFAVHVRVLGNPTHIPQRITWFSNCDVTATDTVPPKWASFSRDYSSFNCGPLDARRPPVGDAIVLGVWVKGPNGAIALVRDTVPVRR